jgi:hypothetical protein
VIKDAAVRIALADAAEALTLQLISPSSDDLNLVAGVRAAAHSNASGERIIRHQRYKRSCSFQRSQVPGSHRRRAIL